MSQDTKNNKDDEPEIALSQEQKRELNVALNRHQDYAKTLEEVKDVMESVGHEDSRKMALLIIDSINAKPDESKTDPERKRDAQLIEQLSKNYGITKESPKTSVTNQSATQVQQDELDHER